MASNNLADLSQQYQSTLKLSTQKCQIFWILFSFLFSFRWENNLSG